MSRFARRRFRGAWRDLNEQAKFDGLNAVAEALLAFQFQERGGDGQPSLKARLGAFWLAEQHLIERAYMTGGKKRG